jgi:hypothetical protein
MQSRRSTRDDILGTYLDTMQSRSALDVLIQSVRRNPGPMRISELWKSTSLSEDSFADLLATGEKLGLLKRESADGQVRVSLTPQGLRRSQADE